MNEKLITDANGYYQGGSSFVFTKERLKQLLAEYRWKKEVAGISLQGMPIPTDDRSKMLINGAVNEALIAQTPNAIFKFKLPSGTFINITHMQMIGIGLAVATHVQKCFHAEGVICEGIDNSNYTTPQEAHNGFDSVYASL